VTRLQFPACPRCQSEAQVISKLLLIGKVSPQGSIANFDEIAGFQPTDQLAVDECVPEVLRQGQLDQFIDGYYCEKCDVGFVPDEFVRHDR